MMAFDFKSAEELKEYLDNIGIEYRFGCLSEKKPEVCHLLGEYLSIFKNDNEKASKIFKANCDDNNHPRSCHAYGSHIIQKNKNKDPKNIDLAYQYFTKACDLNYGSSCFNAGILALTHGSKEGIEKLNTSNTSENLENSEKSIGNGSKGLSYLEKACSLNHMNACYLVSGFYIRGSKYHVIEKDMKRAFIFAKKACELGSINACKNVSTMYRKGDGVEKNDELSKKYKDRAEELESELYASEGSGS